MPDDDAPDLILDIREAAADDHPFALLALASSLLAALEPRRGAPFDDGSSLTVGRDELFDTFFGAALPETSLLLAALAALDGDEVLRQRVRREVAVRDHHLPTWLRRLDDATVAGAWEMTHVFGDDEDVIVGIDLPDGNGVTVVALVNHNLASVVKDAFVIPQPLDEAIEAIEQLAEDPDQRLRPLDPADARVRIAEGVEHGALFVPPFETDTWPVSRPFVDWAVGLLPPGGTGYERREWTDAELDELRRRFLASEHATGLDADGDADLVDHLLWFGSGYGDMDPLRWSPARVDELLLDWVPRKILDDADHLARVPDVLRAFVRFADADRGLRPDLTEQTLGTVDLLEDDYQTTIRTPRHQGPMALLEAMGAPVGPPPGLEGDDLDDADVDTEDLDARIAEIMLDRLARQVGHDELLTFGVRTLPPVLFDPEGVDERHRARVAEIVALVDDACSELFDDPELRFAAHRLLSDVVAGDVTVLSRGKAASAAGVLLWIVAKANDAFESGWGVGVADLMEHLGIGSGGVSGRAPAVLDAAGLPRQEFGGMDLGTTQYLTGDRLRDLVTLRNRYLPRLAASSAAADEALFTTGEEWEAD